METPEAPAVVTCAKDGKLLFLSTAGNVYYRNGISYAQPHGTDFIQVNIERAETVIDVSVGENGDAWILFQDGFVQYIDQTFDNADLSADLGTGYSLVSVGESQLVQMDAGNYEVWGVNRWNEIFRRTGMSAANAGGDDWEQHQGEMTYVSTAEEGIVWAIDDDHDVWVLRAGTISVDVVIDNEPEWSPIPGVKLTYVDVGRQGQLVALKSSGCSFWRKGITKDTPSGVDEWFDLTNDNTNEETYFKFGTIAMCATGNMFATLQGGDSKLYFRGGVSSKFPQGAEWFQS